MGTLADALFSLLQSADLEEIHDVFIKEDIDEPLARTLSNGDLKELGLSLGQRRRFLAAIAEPVAEPRQNVERRQLTVAFCDLVGSTQLATQLDPEDLRDVISAYLDTGIATMQAHGGHLAYTQGDGIMVYFGYPVAQEDDAQRALRAALAAIKAVANLQTRVPQGLQVRLGVATGRVVVGDIMGSASAPQDFVVGETPNLASRLQTLAQPGEIIVSGETHALTRGFFDFEPHSEVELKGFADPVPVFRVKAENATRSRFDARASHGVQPLVGRSTELSQLLSLWDKAKDGHGCVGLVEGPPGIGKSRILRALQNEIRSTPLEWQCAPHLVNRALHPMVRELERAAGIDRGLAPEEQLDKLNTLIAATPNLSLDDFGLLADLLQIEGVDPPTFDVAVKARRTVDAMARRVSGIASAGEPLLLVLEDAHWADTASLEFLDHLVTMIGKLPILLIITFRPEYQPPEEFLKHGEHIQLVPLGTDSVNELVALVGGANDLPATLTRQIAEKTDGVPLFVEELTKIILNALPDLSRGVTSEMLATLNIPSTLQDSLMSRLDNMQRSKEVAQLGAVIGREFTAPMLEAIAPADVDVTASLDELVTAELLNRNGLSGPDYYVFNHALVQDTAYESILKSRRQEIHLTLARAMLDGNVAFRAPEPETIARHCDIGGLTDEAITYWTRAGHEALNRAANLPAVLYLNAALRCLEKMPEGQTRDGTELGIQMALMPAAMSIYGWGAPEVEASAFRARDLAGSLGDGQALYGATWGIWTMHFLRGEMDACLDAAIQTHAMAQGAGAPMLLTTADHAVGYSQFWRGELREATERFRSGNARYDPDIEAAIIGNFQFSSSLAIRIFGSGTLWLCGETEEAAEVRDSALALIDEQVHPPSMAYGLGGLCQTFALQEDWERLDRLSARCLAIAQEEGFILWQFVAETQCAIARGKNRGEHADAINDYMIARDRFLSTGTRLTDILYYPAVGDLMIATGQTDEALALAQSGIAQANARNEKINLAELYRMRGLCQQELGNPSEAMLDFKTAAQVAASQGAIALERRAVAAMNKIMA